MEIAESAVKRNVTWLEAVENAPVDCENATLAKEVMKNCRLEICSINPI
jgi:hypothetical protein